MPNGNGTIGTWVTRGLTLSALIAIVGMLMAQSVDKGVMITDIKHNGETNTKQDEREEIRNEKMDTFILKQTELNTVLVQFVGQQTELNKTQVDLNEKIKEHIIIDESN